MKRIITLAALLLVSLNTGAQSMYDGIAFSENNYYGTARSMSLANAVTALGGDLGMIGINPAGSAVATHSQFVVTPGVGISSSDATISPVAGGKDSFSNHEGKARFALPNVGIGININTGHEHGLRSVHLAVTANRTNQHLNFSNVTGRNNKTSMLGAFAAMANDCLPPDVFDHEPWSGNYPWNLVAAYGSNGIGYCNEYPEGYYLGSTQPYGEGPWPEVFDYLDQYSSREFLGSKTDLLFNVGLDFSDKFYFGVNVGVPITDYSYREIFREHAEDYLKFPVDVSGIDTYFKDFEYRYTYNASIAGVYGKFGFIYLPVKGLRIGAAIQTPSILTIRERYNVYEETFFTSDRASSWSSPKYPGEYRYCLSTPYEFNLGLAYTFSTIGVLSIDYELMDYAVMKFKTVSDDRSLMYDPFTDENQKIKLFSGFSHSVRVGAELNLTSNFALRAGFSMLTSPERYYQQGEYVVTAGDYVPGMTLDKSAARYFDRSKFSYNLGLGYRSNGSFFADLAARVTTYPTDYFYPYIDYLDNLRSPEVTLNRCLIDLALTVGWRF